MMAVLTQRRPGAALVWKGNPESLLKIHFVWEAFES